MVRDAPFRGAAEQVTDATLLGPFDGQIVDAVTGEPVSDATVVGVWNFDRGSGLVGPEGSDVVLAETDKAGRYRIGPLRLSPRPVSSRLVDFHLVVYKRGYAAYRSDRARVGEAEFAVRHNTIALEKWTERDSHAEELLMLRAPRDVARVSGWQAHLANVALYRSQGGQRAPDQPAESTTGLVPTGPAAAGGSLGTASTAPLRPMLLDATELLSPTDLRQRTGDSDLLTQKDLADLPRTPHYHGVHLEATGRAETLDVSYRVWSSPPGGLEPVIERFQVSLGEVPLSGEVTAETWVLEAEDIRAVAFVDRGADAAVLLTCGPEQCTDVATVIVLARMIRDNLENLRRVPADESEELETPATDDESATPAADPAAETEAQE
jgi:hypothetical protein